MGLPLKSIISEGSIMKAKAMKRLGIALATVVALGSVGPLPANPARSCLEQEQPNMES